MQTKVGMQTLKKSFLKWVEIWHMVDLNHSSQYASIQILQNLLIYKNNQFAKAENFWNICKPFSERYKDFCTK